MFNAVNRGLHSPDEQAWYAGHSGEQSLVSGSV
jgi:hypothetical protein